MSKGVLCGLILFKIVRTDTVQNIWQLLTKVGWGVVLALHLGLVKVTIHFVEFLYFLNIIGNGNDLGEKPTVLGQFKFAYISLLNSLNLVLIPDAKLDGHRGIFSFGLTE